jgi:outer membrane protein TolC
LLSETEEMRTARFHKSAWRVAFAGSVAALAPGAASGQTAQSAQTERVVALADVESAARRQPQVLVASAGVDAAVGQAQQGRAPLLPQIVATLHS